MVSSSENSVAIGGSALVNGAANSVALGSYSRATEANTLSIGGGTVDGVVMTRAISNVASKEYSSDTTTHTYAATTGQLYDINKSVAETLGITYEQLTEDAAAKKYFTIGDDTTTKYTVQEALNKLNDNASSASNPLAVTYDDADKESVTLKSAGGGSVKLSGLADAALGTGSTDAVTGAQLFATNTTLGGLGTSAAAVFGTGVSYADGAFTVTGTPFAGADTIAGGFTNLSSSLGDLSTKLNRLGGSLATIIGGNAAYDDTTGALTGKIGFDVVAPGSSGGAGTGGTTAQTTVANGGSLEFVNGSNIEITQEGTAGGTKVTIGTSNTPEFETVTADEITANESLTVAGTGTNSVKIDGDTFTLTGTDGSGGSHTLVISGGGMDMGNTKVTNMAAGEISETSTDGITGGQLWGLGNSVAGILGGTSSFTNGALTAGLTVNGNSYTTIQDALTAAAASGGAGGSVSFADSDSITHEIDNGSHKFSVNPNLSLDSLNIAETVHISSSGINMGGTRLTGLADGGVYQGSTDAVTGNQLWDAYRRIDMIGNELREDINIVGAHAAALSGLHPIQYNPYEPTTLSAAFGTYRDEYAVAVGVFHYVRENLMFNVGASLCSDGDLMGRAGVSLAIGKSTKRRPELARDMVGMQKQMYVMQAKLERLEAEKAQDKETIRRNEETLRKNEEIMKQNAELIRELTKRLEAKK